MLRSWRPAPMTPSTSASMSSCNTDSATVRKKSPSPAFCKSSINGILESVIVASLGVGVASELHHTTKRPDDHLRRFAQGEGDIPLPLANLRIYTTPVDSNP